MDPRETDYRIGQWVDRIVTQFGQSKINEAAVAAHDATAWDGNAHPDDRIRAIAVRLAAMLADGKLILLPDNSRREMEQYSMLLNEIAGDVRALRVPNGRGPVGIGAVLPPVPSRR